MKTYSADVIHGLECQHKVGKNYDYLVFLENGHIKWWITPVKNRKGKYIPNLFGLYHKHGKKHSQGEHSGKPKVLMTYIANHECYERGLIPPFSSWGKNGDLDFWNNILTGKKVVSKSEWCNTCSHGKHGYEHDCNEAMRADCDGSESWAS
jgi:hypothetical protein